MLVTPKPMSKVKPAKAPKEKHKYVFPNIMAKMMKNVPMNVQLESSMMATSLILLGLILMGIYSLAFTQQAIGLKLLIGLNLVGGFIFMMSTLVTTYQQYVSYMDVMSIQAGLKDLGALSGVPNLPIDDSKMNVKKYNRWNQFFFFGGILLLILAFVAKFYLFSEVITTLTPTLQDIVFGLILLVAVIFIMIPFIKNKIGKNKLQKPITPQQAQRPVQTPILQQKQAPQPVSRPVQPIQRPIVTPQPVQRPVQRPIMTPRPVQSPVQRPIEQPKPQLVFRQPQPVQRPIVAPQPIQRPVQAQRPIQQPIQRPIQRPQPVARPILRRPIQQVPVQQRAPVKPGIFSRLRRPTAPMQQRPIQARPIKVDQKAQKALDGVKKVLDEKVYEINRLKSQQR